MTKLTRFDLDNIITANKSKFKAGSVMTQADFVALFQMPSTPTRGGYKKIHRAHMKIVAMQQKVNALMAENGLYLKARDYYSEFHVLEKPQTKNTVVRYSSQVERDESCEIRLEAGLKARTAAGTWGTYNRLYDRKTKQRRPTNNQYRQPANAGRATATLNRVTAY